MDRLLRLAAAAALAFSPALDVGRMPVPAFARPAPLRAVLRPDPDPVPPWLERAVCERAVELGEGCAEVAAAVFSEARRARLDPVLVLAIIEIESSWDPGAVSARNARGLMQLRRPALEGEAAGGRLRSSDARDPLVNVRAGVRYFSRLRERFDDTELALVAYNAGPHRLAGYLKAEGGIPARFWEYPRRVRREERRLRARLERPAALLAAADEVAGRGTAEE